MHTGQSYEKIEQTLDRDYFLSSDQAKDFGLIDRVLTKRDEIELAVTGKPG
jgi:ATP-dependent Clp protease protease subunit